MIELTRYQKAEIGNQFKDTSVTITQISRNLQIPRDEIVTYILLNYYRYKVYIKKRRQQ